MELSKILTKNSMQQRIRREIITKSVYYWNHDLSFSQDHFVIINIYCTVSTSWIWQHGSACGTPALSICLRGRPEAGRAHSHPSRAINEGQWGQLTLELGTPTPTNTLAREAWAWPWAIVKGDTTTPAAATIYQACRIRKHKNNLVQERCSIIWSRVKRWVVCWLAKGANEDTEIQRLWKTKSNEKLWESQVALGLDNVTCQN